MRWATWVRADPLPPAPVGAIVVLSADVSSDSTLQNGGADRLLAGLELFRDRVAPRLVTTRVERRGGSWRVTSDADQARLIGLAGADSGWIVLDGVVVTRDEATVAAAALLPRGVDEIVVVTSPSHTRRACATFERVGFTVWCRPARERERQTWHGRSPSQRLSVFRALLYELLGFVKYRAEGWV